MIKFTFIWCLHINYKCVFAVGGHNHHIMKKKKNPDFQKSKLPDFDTGEIKAI